MHQMKTGLFDQCLYLVANFLYHQHRDYHLRQSYSQFVCQFGEKGVCNSYFILYYIRYSINKFAEVELTSSVINYSQFMSFVQSDSPSFLHYSLLYSHKI